MWKSDEQESKKWKVLRSLITRQLSLITCAHAKTQLLEPWNVDILRDQSS